MAVKNYNTKDMLSFSAYSIDQFRANGRENLQVLDVENWNRLKHVGYFIEFSNPSRGLKVSIEGSEGKEAFEVWNECRESGIDFEWGGMIISTTDPGWEWRDSYVMSKTLGE